MERKSNKFVDERRQAPDGERTERRLYSRLNKKGKIIGIIASLIFFALVAAVLFLQK